MIVNILGMCVIKILLLDSLESVK